MGLTLEIAHILMSVVLVGGIAVFVVFRMKYKHNNGTLGKKETKSAQNLLDSLIPFGMMAGSIVAVPLSIFFSISLLSTISWGTGIGLLLGYLSYEIYSEKEDSHS